MYFYELHEGDDDVFSDLVLAHDQEYDPNDFFELVQGSRRRVQATFEEDTLIEAVAADLEREHGFVAIVDNRLVASVHVSADEDENYLTEIKRTDEELPSFRGIYLDLEDRPGSLN